MQQMSFVWRQRGEGDGVVSEEMSLVKGQGGEGRVSAGKIFSWVGGGAGGQAAQMLLKHITQGLAATVVDTIEHSTHVPGS